MLEVILIVFAAFMWPTGLVLIEYLLWGRKERAKKNNRVGQLRVRPREHKR